MKILNKIDLHLHIDGSARPETVYELSRKYQIEPECHKTLEEIRNSMIIPDGEYDPDFLTFEIFSSNSGENASILIDGKDILIFSFSVQSSILFKSGTNSR